MLHCRVIANRQLPCRLRRRGLTLMEVIVALAIFLVSMVAVGNLLYIGMHRALEAQQQAIGQVKCQSKLSEVISGSIPLSSQGSVPFDEDPGWIWSLECNQQEVANFWSVKVTVQRQVSDGHALEVSLTQMVMDPNQRGINAGPPASSSSSSSSSGTTSTTGY